MSSPSRIQHPLRAEKRGTFNQKIFPRQPQNTIFRTFSLPPDFPPIGNIFFQSLENHRKIFPIIGKTAPIFPTIGNFFSNHWKTPPPPFPRRNPCDFPCAVVGRAVPARRSNARQNTARPCTDAHYPPASGRIASTHPMASDGASRHPAARGLAALPSTAALLTSPSPPLSRYQGKPSHSPRIFNTPSPMNIPPSLSFRLHGHGADSVSSSCAEVTLLAQPFALERFKFSVTSQTFSHHCGRAEARPSRCALHGEGRASARPQWEMAGETTAGSHTVFEIALALRGRGNTTASPMPAAASAPIPRKTFAFPTYSFTAFPHEHPPSLSDRGWPPRRFSCATRPHVSRMEDTFRPPSAMMFPTGFPGSVPMAAEDSREPRCIALNRCGRVPGVVQPPCSATGRRKGPPTWP